MKKPLLTLLSLLLCVGVMGQTKPKKETIAIKADSGILWSTATSLTAYYQQHPDTVQAYFKEITGVKDGELVTQWVKGYRIVQQPVNSWAYGYTNFAPDNQFLYPDKTKVTNKVIQSY